MHINQDSATREELGLLAVMDALAEEQQVTQRELSRRTGLNLKKVNYCLHKLVEKGHVKFNRAMSNPDKRAYLYILTPAGLREKSRLTYRFLQYTLSQYNQAEMKFRRCLQDIADSGIRKIVLFGVSETLRIVQGLVGEFGIEIVGIVDSEYGESEYDGLPVLKGSVLDGVHDYGVLIAALDALDRVEVELRAWQVPEDRVWQIA